MEESDAGELREILKYPDDSAGGIMAVEVMSVPEGITTAQAIEEVRIGNPGFGKLAVVWSFLLKYLCPLAILTILVSLILDPSAIR